MFTRRIINNNNGEICKRFKEYKGKFGHHLMRRRWPRKLVKINLRFEAELSRAPESYYNLTRS